MPRIRRRAYPTVDSIAWERLRDGPEYGKNGRARGKRGRRDSKGKK